jgi:hypothetical protein
MYSNRWSTMPVRAFPDLRLPRPDRRARLDQMPGSDVPVIRQPFDPSDSLPYWALGKTFDGDLLYDRHEAEAAGEVRNVVETPAVAEMTELLESALRAIAAPAEQFARLGLG